MNLVPDGIPRVGWALRNAATGVIAAATVCESEHEANGLCHAARTSQAHLVFEVVAVSIAVQAVPA